MYVTHCSRRGIRKLKLSTHTLERSQSAFQKPRETRLSQEDRDGEEGEGLGERRRKQERENERPERKREAVMAVQTETWRATESRRQGGQDSHHQNSGRSWTLAVRPASSQAGKSLFLMASSGTQKEKANPSLGTTPLALALLLTPYLACPALP